MAKFTESQIQALQRGFYRGYPDTIIARELGLTHGRVFRFRVKSGITLAWVVERRYAWWERLFKKGISLEVIADVYGVTRQTVYITLNRRGVSAREVKKQIEEKRSRAAKKLKSLAQSQAAGPLDW